MVRIGGLIKSILTAVARKKKINTQTERQIVKSIKPNKSNEKTQSK